MNFFARSVFPMLLSGVSLYSQDSLATGAMLTPFPSSQTAGACDKWAAEQDEDAVYMWGVMESGGSLESIGLKRLALHCLGDVTPEIVGFGSSVGFDDAYCMKHEALPICENRQTQQVESEVDETASTEEMSCASASTTSALNSIARMQLDGIAMMISGGHMKDDERNRMLARIEYRVSNVRTRSPFPPLVCAAEMLLSSPNLDGISQTEKNGLNVIVDFLRASGKAKFDLEYTVEKTDDGKTFVEIEQ